LGYINFLLFRFHFQAGAVKLQSRDSAWSNFTAIAYHYLTQPIPNLLAWLAYKWPLWFQKLSCFFMFAVELVVPFGIFFSETIRFGVFIAFFSLQLMIWLTGNFSFLNHLTAVFCIILLSNRYLEPIFGQPPTLQEVPVGLNIILTAVGAVLLFLQVVQWIHHYFPNAWFSHVLRLQAPFHLANRYGIFAVMTTKRYEIVIEGSEDGKEWKEYTFYWKPSELDRRPRRISPLQPRLDWQVWFLPFHSFEQADWFQRFILCLLRGNKPVLSLLRHNPFPEKPPLYIRVLMYDYTFTDWSTLKKTGRWWNRVLVGPYCPPLTLR